MDILNRKKYCVDEQAFCAQFEVLLPYMTLDAVLAAIAAALPSGLGLQILGSLWSSGCPVDESVIAAVSVNARACNPSVLILRHLPPRPRVLDA